MSALVDPRWTGSTEGLARGFGGTVQWEPDSVVLQLPDHPHGERVADLDGLSLYLLRIGALVVLDASMVTQPDASLVEFLRKLVKSGLMLDLGPMAA